MKWIWPLVSSEKFKEIANEDDDVDENGHSTETKINLYQNDFRRKVWRRKDTVHSWSQTMWCPTWWMQRYRMGMYVCQEIWVTALYWRCDDLIEGTGWMVSIQGYPLCSDSNTAKLIWCSSHCRWMKTQTLKQPRAAEGEEMWCYSVAKSVTWFQPEKVSTHWRLTWGLQFQPVID